MCTDRLPGNYCPFGDINECNCLELFTIFGDIPEDSSYIEELLDELSTSLDDNDTTESLSEDAATHGHQRTWITNAYQMTSTPIRRRLCYNPVLTNVESPVLGNRNTTQPARLGMSVTTQGGSGRQCVTGSRRNISKYRVVLLNVYRFRET